VGFAKLKRFVKKTVKKVPGIAVAYNPVTLAARGVLAIGAEVVHQTPLRTTSVGRVVRNVKGATETIAAELVRNPTAALTVMGGTALAALPGAQAAGVALALSGVKGAAGSVVTREAKEAQQRAAATYAASIASSASSPSPWSWSAFAASVRRVFTPVR
jgi:hypothetical protein